MSNKFGLSGNGAVLTFFLPQGRRRLRRCRTPRPTGGSVLPSRRRYTARSGAAVLVHAAGLRGSTYGEIGFLAHYSRSGENRKVVPKMAAGGVLDCIRFVLHVLVLSTSSTRIIFTQHMIRQYDLFTGGAAPDSD